MGWWSPFIHYTNIQTKFQCHFYLSASKYIYIYIFCIFWPCAVEGEEDLWPALKSRWFPGSSAHYGMYKIVLWYFEVWELVPETRDFSPNTSLSHNRATYNRENSFFGRSVCLWSKLSGHLWNCNSIKIKCPPPLFVSPCYLFFFFFSSGTVHSKRKKRRIVQNHCAFTFIFCFFFLFLSFLF